MKITFGDKEYSIKFGYKATLKSGLLHRLAEVEQEQDNDVLQIEQAMLFVPELILVGLQVHHKEEFGYDYDTKEGYEEQLDKVFDMVDEYLSTEGADFQALYIELEQDLLNNGFLASLFRKEQDKVQKKSTSKKAKEEN